MPHSADVFQFSLHHKYFYVGGKFAEPTPKQTTPKQNMKFIFFTITLIGLLISCGNAQNSLKNKTFIAETGKGCEMHINGGLDETYYMILRFQTENKVEINAKKVSLGSINGVKKDTTQLHKEGVFTYKLYDDGRLFIDEWFMFNGGIKINEANEIIAIIHSSDYIDKKKMFTFKEMK